MPSNIPSDCEARGALKILAACCLTIVFASAMFIGTGAAQMVRSELPNGWVLGGLMPR